MSIASEIARLSQNVSDSLDAVAAKGVVVPSGSNSDDLPGLIAQITSGSGSAITIQDVADSHGGTHRIITAVSLAGDTVSPATLLSGYTAHNSLGEAIVGTASGGGSPNLQAKTHITPLTSSQTIRADTGYDGLSSVQIDAMPTGTATAPTSISGTAATVSTGTNTLTLTKTVSVTPRITTAGYVSSGTAGNASVSLTANVTTKAAATITPGTSNQTIASGTYLTGTQTIAGDANLVGSNILSGKSIFGVAGTVAFQTIYSGSSAPSSSTGVNGDIYIQTA